jgi:hypothetical protein
MVKTHPQTFSRAIEEERQEDGDSTAEYDEGSYWHGLAGSQRDGDNNDQEFADDQVHGHGSGVVARLAFKDEAAHRAAFVGLKDTGEDLPPAAYRTALAQSPPHE